MTFHSEYCQRGTPIFTPENLTKNCMCERGVSLHFSAHNHPLEVFRDLFLRSVGNHESGELLLDIYDEKTLETPQ